MATSLGARVATLSFFVVSLVGACATDAVDDANCIEGKCDSGHEVGCERPQPDPVVKHPSTMVPPDILSTQEELGQSYRTFYAQDKRLNRRAYRDDAQSKYLIDVHSGETLEVPNAWVDAITHHMSTALALGYAEYVYYPDMGHVHILKRVGATESDPDARLFLYHVGELLRYRDGSSISGPLRTEPWIVSRYQHRNFIGWLNATKPIQIVTAPPDQFNTVRSIPGYNQELTLYFSAGRQGCFKTGTSAAAVRFDIGI